MSFGIKIQEVKKQITKSWRKKQHKNDCNIQQEGILHAHACIRWTTIVGAHQIWRREIENSRKVTFLLKAISLVLWIPYFPTKNGLHDKNWTFSTRFSVVDSSWLAVGFLDLFKTLKTQRQKSLFLRKSDFHWQSKGGLFICTLSHVKLIPEIHFCTCHKNMKSMGIFSMGQFSRVFTEKYIKNIFQEMKNGLSLRQEQCYIITWAFHKLTCRQNTMHPEKKNNTYFSSPLEDRYFS